ncbi:unnamed protein product, partial [Discosporangium mesarthrocarpum]
ALTTQELARTAQEAASAVEGKKIVNEELDAVKRELAQTTQELAETTQEAAFAVEGKERVNEELDAVKQELAQTTQELAQTAQEAASAVEGKKVANEEVDAVKRELAQTTQEAASAVEGKEIVNEELDAVKRELAQTTQELARTAQEAALAVKRKEVANEELDAVKQVLAQTTQELAQTAQEAASALDGKEIANMELDAVKQELAQTTQELAQTAQETASAVEGMEVANVEPDALEQELARTTQELAQTAQEAASAVEGKEVAYEELDSIKRKLAQTTQELAQNAQELARTAQEAALAVKGKKIANEELGAVKEKLVQTVQELAQTAQEAASAIEEKEKTKEELDAVKQELTWTAQELGCLTDALARPEKAEMDLAQWGGSVVSIGRKDSGESERKAEGSGEEGEAIYVPAQTPTPLPQDLEGERTARRVAEEELENTLRKLKALQAQITTMEEELSHVKACAAAAEAQASSGSEGMKQAVAAVEEMQEQLCRKGRQLQEVAAATEAEHTRAEGNEDALSAAWAREASKRMRVSNVLTELDSPRTKQEELQADVRERLPRGGGLGGEDRRLGQALEDVSSALENTLTPVRGASGQERVVRGRKEVMERTDTEVESCEKAGVARLKEFRESMEASMEAVMEDVNTQVIARLSRADGKGKLLEERVECLRRGVESAVRDKGRLCQLVSESQKARHEADKARCAAEAEAMRRGKEVEDARQELSVKEEEATARVAEREVVLNELKEACDEGPRVSDIALAAQQESSGPMSRLQNIRAGLDERVRALESEVQASSRCIHELESEVSNLSTERQRLWEGRETLLQDRAQARVLLRMVLDLAWASQQLQDGIGTAIAAVPAPASKRAGGFRIIPRRSETSGTEFTCASASSRTSVDALFG